jgi:hypothetical protein
MNSSDHTLVTEEEKNPGQTTIKTTLYDLIEAISGEVDPGEDKMIVATVSHLLNSGWAKFTGEMRDQKMFEIS